VHSKIKTNTRHTCANRYDRLRSLSILRWFWPIVIDSSHKT